MISRKFRIILIASLFAISTTLTVYFVMAMIVFYKLPDSNYWAVTSWPGNGPPLFFAAFAGLSVIAIAFAVKINPKMN